MMPENVFETLQKPTMSLIAGFYDIPKDVSDFFADMMAVYEADPTEETARMIWDKISSHDKATDKKAWLSQKVSSVSAKVRAVARKKYLDEQAPVPKGVPMSGQLLTFLDVVPRKEKDILMDAQAAARLIKALENPCRTFKENAEVYSAVKGQVKYRASNLGGQAELPNGKNEAKYYKMPDGSFENAFLDKPFATSIQRLAHVADVLIEQANTSGNTACFASSKWGRKLKVEAAAALAEAAVRIRPMQPELADAFGALAARYDVSTGDLLAGYGRLTKQDYQQLCADYKGTSIADVLSHRIEQLMPQSLSTRAVYRLPEEEIRKNQLNITITSCLMQKKSRD